MKNDLPKKIVIMSFVILAGAIFCIILWPQNEAQPPAESQPAEQQMSEVEATSESSSPAQSCEYDIAKSLVAKQGQKPGQITTSAEQSALSAKKPADMHAVSHDEAATEGGVSSEGGYSEHLLRPKHTLLLDERVPMIVSQEHQRHLEQYRHIENSSRLPYSQKQLEQRKRELLARLSKRYQKLIKNMDQMKQAELKRQRASRPLKSRLKIGESPASADTGNYKFVRPDFPPSKDSEDKEH